MKKLYMQVWCQFSSYSFCNLYHLLQAIRVHGTNVSPLSLSLSLLSNYICFYPACCRIQASWFHHCVCEPQQDYYLYQEEKVKRAHFQVCSAFCHTVPKQWCYFVSSSVSDAKAYVDFILNSIRRKDLFHSIEIKPESCWEYLMWMDQVRNNWPICTKLKASADESRPITSIKTLSTSWLKLVWHPDQYLVDTHIPWSKITHLSTKMPIEHIDFS